MDLQPGSSPWLLAVTSRLILRASLEPQCPQREMLAHRTAKGDYKDPISIYMKAKRSEQPNDWNDQSLWRTQQPAGQPA